MPIGHRGMVHMLQHYSSDAFTPPHRRLGQGSYGEVMEVVEVSTNKVVALKRVYLRHVSPGYFPIAAYREMQAHACLSHPNVVNCWGVFGEAHALTLVMEACLCDLHALVEYAGGLSEGKARTVLRDVLQGLHHCHEMGVVHRDIKSSNILVRENGEVCLGDFGLARPFRPTSLGGVGVGLGMEGGGGGLGGSGVLSSEERAGGGQQGGPAPSPSPSPSPSPPPPHLTPQITSRWYRAPEVMFGSSVYGPPIDMWAVGALAVEVVSGKPWAAGGSDLEQLSLVVAQLGSPEVSWPGVVGMPDYPKVSFKPCPRADLGLALGGTPSPHFLSLVSSLLQWNPEHRLTASQALDHPFFHPSLPCDSLGELCTEIKVELAEVPRADSLVDNGSQYSSFHTESSAGGEGGPTSGGSSA